MRRVVDPSHTREWVRDVVRSGLLTPERVLAEVEAAVLVDHPDLPPASTARAWVDEELAAWRRDAASWPEVTDHDRLQRAFARIEASGIVVLQGCADHWSARDVLRTRRCRGVMWFTPTDIWHAIDEPMLEVNLWHATTANISAGDPLLEEALGVFAECGLSAHFDEGRIEVTARWHRRPAPPV